MSGVPPLIIGRKREVTPALRCSRTNLPPLASLQRWRLPPQPRLGEVRSPEATMRRPGLPGDPPSSPPES